MEKTLGFDHNSMRDSGLRLDAMHEELSRLSRHDHFDGLPFAALGLIGEPARRKHNEVLQKMSDDLSKGSVSAYQMFSVVRLNDYGYLESDNAAIRELTRLPDYTHYPTAFEQNIELPRGDELVTDPFWTVDGIHTLPENRLYEGKGQQIAALGAGATIGAGAAVVARFAGVSQRTAALLTGAARMSAIAAVAAGLWTAAVSPEDEYLTRAVDYWWGTAQDLQRMFGGLDARDVIAKAWEGEARDAAEAVVRDFMTAGSQRFATALGQVQGLQQAIKTLNLVHDAVFYLTSGLMVTLATLAWLSRTYPMALAAKEAIGRFLLRGVTKGLAAIGAAVALVAVPMLWMRYAELDGGQILPPPDGVPQTDFPRIAVA
ncbi:hypothetical protein [Nonomuraea sediminis]|uniref:hypothetical protein n=1 Tax=Nonomuraea sediminis TaxID=2835864 RepID=UPI001BDCC01F|nr:hypothetical protein [Nonomuraea sediminis]